MSSDIYCEDCGMELSNCTCFADSVIDSATSIEFFCPYTLEQKYEMACSGEYGAFELYDPNSSADGITFRGFRKGYGTTGIYSTYRDALEAAFTVFGNTTSMENI